MHSIYDFEGEKEELAEAAYQAVRVTQSCESPGDPPLDAWTFAGFVYGYTASNGGGCHSGWFSKLHVYNRNWRLVASQEQTEQARRSGGRLPGSGERGHGPARSLLNKVPMG